MAGGIIGSLMYAVGFKLNSGGIDEADNKVKTLTKGVIGLGAAGGAAMIGIGAAAISAASNFEDAMSSVQMATGQTEDQMLATKEIAKHLYNQNFGEDWDDLGGSIAAVAKATHLTGDALESASREAMLYANQFDGEVTESIASASVAMNNFGVTSTEAFNLLTQGQTRGVDTQGDMLDSINEYSQAFASMGFSMEDTMGYFDNGIKAGARNTDLLGDAMNEFSIQSIEAGGTAVKSFQMLGLDSDKMMKTFSQGGPAAKQAFKDIVSMISEVGDPVAQNTIGVGLFGTQFEELGVKAFSALDDVNTGFDQSKDSAANLNNGFNTFGESMEYLKRQIETGILIPIGEKLLPYLTQFGSWISSHQPEIAALGDTIGNNLGKAISFVTDRAKEVYDFVTSNWTAVTNVVIGLGTAVATVKATFVALKVVGVVTKLFKAYRAGTVMATLAQWGLNTAMLANPMTWIVVGIAALVVAIVLLIRNWDWVKSTMARFWAWTKGVFGGIGLWFTQRFNEAITGIKSVFGIISAWFGSVWEGIKNVFIAVGSWFAGIFNGAYQAVITSFGVIGSWFSSVWEGIKKIFSVVGEWFSGIFSGAFESIKTAFGGVGEWFTGLWDGIKGTFSGFINLMITGINTLINGLNKIQIKMPEWAGGKEFGVNIPNIPMLANGGIATGPTLAMIGEGAESEAVLPLSKLENLLNRPKPESAPARSTNNGQKIDLKLPDIRIIIQGNADSGTVKQIDSLIDQKMQEVFEAVARIMGVDVIGAN